MVITARFSSVCPDCGSRIAAGSKVEWRKGDKARHVNCSNTSTPALESRGSESGIVYTRFSSVAEVYRNRKGRCEDAPCCGCCS